MRCQTCNIPAPCVSVLGLSDAGWTATQIGWLCPNCFEHSKTLKVIHEVAAGTPSVVQPTVQEWIGPKTVEEARMFLEGVKSGLTRYAVAVGHSGLRSENEKLRELMDAAGFECIETFEKLTGRTV